MGWLSPLVYESREQEVNLYMLLSACGNEKRKHITLLYCVKKKFYFHIYIDM